MMKFLIQICLLAIIISVGFSVAAPQRAERGFAESNNPIIPILHMELKTNAGAGGDAYQFAYETGNKIAQRESGDATKREGSYAYIAPDGQQISMSYVADEGGFRPQGAHMPLAPPIPEEIRKAVEQNLADEARGIVDDGQYRPEVGNFAAPTSAALSRKYNV